MAPDLLRLEGTDQVSALDLGGASNTARYRAIATPGSTIVACLARRARDLERPSTLVLREVPLPTRAPGEVKVARHARGVGSVDVLMIAGSTR